MFIERHIGGFSGGVRKNQDEIRRWIASMSAEGYRYITKRFRGRLRFAKWVGPGFSDGSQLLLFRVPRLKKRGKQKRRRKR